MDGNEQVIQQDALVMVHLRNYFYRTKFRFMLGIFVVSLIVNLILAAIAVYLIQHPTEALYFPADKVGRLIKVLPLQGPNMSTQQVADWAVEAVQAAYSYDFINYRQQLQNAQKYFTEYGWRNYMRGLTESNNLQALTVRKQIVVAKVVAPPKLLVEGVLGGALAWKFQMPVLVTYATPPFNAKSTIDNPLLVTVIVQRQDLLKSYQGLGILQLIADIATTS